MDDSLAELLAGKRIIEPEFDRAPRYPDGARRGLDPRTLEGTHQLLEALPLRAAEQRVSGRTHRVELERIFAQPAIAENGTAAWWDRLGKYVSIAVVAVSIKNKNKSTTDHQRKSTCK